MGTYFQFNVQMLSTNLVILVPSQCHLGCCSLKVYSLSTFIPYVIPPLFVLRIEPQEGPVCNGPFFTTIYQFLPCFTSKTYC